MFIKKGVVFIITLIAVKSGAQPLCSGVLRNIIITEADRNVIDQIAKLRLELDFAHIQGDHNIVTSAMAQNYPRRVSDLNDVLGERFSETEIKDLVVQRIHELQVQERTAIQTEASDRARQSHSKDGAFQKSRQIPMDDFSTASDLFEYMPEQNSFLVRSHGKKELVLFHALTQERTVLQEDNKTAGYSSEQKELVAIDRLGKLLKISPRVHAEVETGLKDLDGKMAINFNGTKVVVAEKNAVYLVDVTTGTSETLLRSKNLGHTNFTFISENEVLVASGALRRINVDTKAVEFVDTGGSQIQDVHLSPDRKLLLWTGQRLDINTLSHGAGVVALADLNAFSQNEVSLPIHMRTAKFTNVPGEIYVDTGVLRGLYQFKDFETAVHTLPTDSTLPANTFVLNPTFDSTDRVFLRIPYNDPLNQKGGTIVEVWERQ